MNPESKQLTTADLARAGGQPVTEPIEDQVPADFEDGPRECPGATVLQKESELKDVPAARTQPAAAPQQNIPGKPVPATTGDVTAPLFEEKEADDLRARWNHIQVGFVDEPRTAVEHADTLIAETIKRLAESFAEGRQKLEGEWGSGGDSSTETLRLTLQRYRSFFNRLLAI